MQVQERFFGEGNYAVKTEHGERAVRTERDLDARDGPLKLNACRAVQDAIGGAEKIWLGWAQPIGEKPARAQIEEAGGKVELK